MDAEIRKALANIRRRRSEIARRSGKADRDDGPVFDKAGRTRKERTTLYEEEDFEFDDLEDLE